MAYEKLEDRERIESVMKGVCPECGYILNEDGPKYDSGEIESVTFVLFCPVCEKQYVIKYRLDKAGVKQY